MKILIVDDSKTNLKLLRINLEVEGFTVCEAFDGVEALAAIQREMPDAIITDVLMPNLDGFALCHQLRRNDRTKHIPILVYTSTYNSPADEKMAHLVGADKYLVKPAPVPTLVRVLQEITSGTHRAAGVQAELPSDLVVMREYNAVLVRKLEERNQELESTQAELMRFTRKLETRAAELEELNQGLEQTVAERTNLLRQKAEKLEAALAEVKQLSGLLPICSYCKKIRDDKNYWQTVESYLGTHADVRFSHSYCPDCFQTRVQPEIEKFMAANRPNQTSSDGSSALSPSNEIETTRES